MFDDCSDEFLTAADRSSKGAVGPPVRVILAGPADERVPLLSVALGECECFGRAAVMLAGLLDIRIR